MITISRGSRYSLCVNFDKDGAINLLHTLECALVNDVATVNIIYDSVGWFFGRGKRKKTFPVKLTIVKGSGEESMYQKEGSIILNVCEESIVYAISRFKDCIECGSFFPPEFIEIKVPKEKERVEIYCNMA